MATVLVVEDDPAVCRLLALLLESDSHHVLTAEDGLDGLSKVLSGTPDLIVADYSMPKVNGLAMLAAIRANARTASIPVVFLVTTPDPLVEAKIRALGTVTYLTKPVDRSRLLAAVSGQLRALEGRRLADVAGKPVLATHLQFGNNLGATERSAIMTAPVRAQPAGDADRHTEGTVLFLDLRNLPVFLERLELEEIVLLLNRYFAKVSQHVGNNAGWIVKLAGDGLVAMFEDADARGQSHALRALKAAMFVMMDTREMGAWIDARFPGRGLPPFTVGAGLHSGSVSVCRIAGTTTTDASTVIGDTVNIASRLENKTGELGWSIVASRICCDLAGVRVRAGRRNEVPIKGRAGTVEIVEVLGLTPRSGASTEQSGVYPAIEEAIAANAALLRGAPG